MDPKVADKPTLNVEVPHETFELIEREDEEQILAELQGRVTEKYVYELKGQKDESGNPIYGLSWAGTNWACREYAKRGEAIRIVSKPEIQPDPISAEHIIVSVVAQRIAVNIETGKEVYLDSAVGVKRQWTKRERKVWKNGEVVGRETLVDDFFIEKAVSKAQRNAKQALLPTDFVKEVVKQAIQQKNNPKAAQAAKPGMKPPVKPAAAAPAAATPTGGEKPAAAKPALTAPTKGVDPMGALRQKFWMVLKKASGITADADARKLLKALTGKDKTTELDEAALRALGKALTGVISGTNRFGKDAGGHPLIQEVANGNFLYPIPSQHMVDESTPLDAPPAEEPPPEQPGGMMF